VSFFVFVVFYFLRNLFCLQYCFFVCSPTCLFGVARASHVLFERPYQQQIAIFWQSAKMHPFQATLPKTMTIFRQSCAKILFGATWQSKKNILGQSFEAACQQELKFFVTTAKMHFFELKRVLATSFACSYGRLQRSTVLQVLFSVSSCIRNVVSVRGRHKSESSYHLLPYYRRRFSSRPCRNGRLSLPWF